MEKYSTFLQKSSIEMDTFNVMLLLFIWLHSLKNLVHDFKSPFLDIEITVLFSHLNHISDL